MNKNFFYKDYFQSIGLEEKPCGFFGEYRGYEISIYPGQKYGYVIGIFIAFNASQETKNNIISQLADKKIKFSKFIPTKLGMSCLLTGLTVASLGKHISSIIESVFDVISSNDAKGVGYCPLCGNPLTEDNKVTHLINDCYVSLDKDCLDSLVNEVERENKAFADAPNNYLKGFGGAILGALAGGLLHYIFFSLGLVSVWSSVVGVVLGAYLYKKFGGKPNTMMVVIPVFTTIVIMLGITHLLYVNLATNYVNVKNIKVQGSAFNYLMKKMPEFKKEYSGNMILTAVFSIIGGVIEAFDVARRIRRETHI